MKKMNWFSVRMKLMSSILLAVMIPTLIIGMLCYQLAKESLTEAGMTDLENMVSSAYSMATALDVQVQAGKITEAEAQAQMQNLLVGPKTADGTRDLSKSAVKVGTTGYMFAQDSQGVLQMHPKLEGTSIWETQNGVGKLIAENKNGRVRYAWQNPGETEQRYKITVLKHYEPWDWILAVGSYEEEFYGAAEHIKRNLYLTLAGEFVLGMLLSWWLSSRMTTPLVSLGRLMEELGQGNLINRSEDGKRRDEYGELARNFNRAVDNLAELIRRVTEASLQVAASSQQVTASAEQTSRSSEQIAYTIAVVAEDAEQQLEGVQESSQVVGEISSSVREITASVQTVHDTSTQATVVAEEGQAVVQTTVAQMQRIDGQMTATMGVMAHLDGKAGQIGEITTLITSIANQTNLLALNAAIEAARAGEHGRGFSVVADEVRKLAEQSADAARQTAELIREIQEDMAQASVAMREGTLAVGEGRQLVDRTGAAFQDILHAVQTVSGQLESVSAAAQQVNAGSHHMETAIAGVAATSEHMAASTQTVSAAVQETNASMEEIANATNMLAEMADELMDALQKFQI